LRQGIEAQLERVVEEGRAEVVLIGTCGVEGDEIEENMAVEEDEMGPVDEDATRAVEVTGAPVVEANEENGVSELPVPVWGRHITPVPIVEAMSSFRRSAKATLKT
jgi:Ni,Fe-hydrogenase III small subunit